MENIFTGILLGHLAGDYLLQSKKMAINKANTGLTGLFWCTFHSLIYTASICLFIRRINLWLFLLIFLSHWPIDRWSLGNVWLGLIGGRKIKTAFESKEKYHEIDLIFSCIVYTVADNALHLILLWLMTKII